jgi:WD40 repeat protein
LASTVIVARVEEEAISVHDASTLEELVSITTAGTRVYAWDGDIDSVNGGILFVGTDSGDVSTFNLVPNLDDQNLPYDQCDRDYNCPWDDDPTPYLKPGAPPLIVEESQQLASGLSGGVYWVDSITRTATGSFGVANVADRYAGPSWSIAKPIEGDLRVTGFGPEVTIEDSANPGLVTFIDRLTGTRRTLELSADLRVDRINIDGTRLVAAVGASDNDYSEFVVLDAQTGAELHRVDTGFNFGGNGNPTYSQVTLSPDNRKLLIETIHFMFGPDSFAVWDLESGIKLGEMAKSETFTSIAWTPTSDGLVTTDLLGSVSLLGLDLKPTRTITIGEGFTVRHVTTAPAVGGVAVAVENGDVILLATPSLQQIGEPFRSGGDQLQESAVSPDGSFVAALDRDGRLHTWNVNGRTPIGPPILLDTFTPYLTNIYFDPQGHLIKREQPSDPSVWRTGPVLSFDPAELIAKACEIAGRELTAEEWSTYVGAQAQRPCLVVGSRSVEG